MKKAKRREMADEYDFAKGVRGKYAQRVGGASNVVVLEPDVARKFKTAEAVNRALREHLTRCRKAAG